MLLHETPPPKAKPGKKTGKRTGARRPPPQTFLVAATVPEGDGSTGLGVYAAVTRTPAEALNAVRDLIGADAPVGLTGKLSGRMAKALGLKPGEVRRI